MVIIKLARATKVPLLAQLVACFKFTASLKPTAQPVNIYIHLAWNEFKNYTH